MTEEKKELHKFEKPGELRKRLIMALAIIVPTFVILKLILG